MNVNALFRALVVCGPTASGKSSIAVAVAQQIDGEIVNADSRQIYRGMEIGTGVPTKSQRLAVPHHLYAFVDPAERYSAARYVREAATAIAGIASRGKMPILVGGTGFYIEALLGRMPLDRPPADDALRERLRREASVHPPSVLWEWLHVRAPRIASETRRADGYRIVRGLERALARVHGGDVASPPPAIDAAVIRLSMPRQALTERIGHRVADMFASGIIAEAVAVRAAAADAPALSGLGYAEALCVWDGLATQREAMARALLRTYQYAKRQATWFRRFRDAVVIDALDERVAIDRIAVVARERFMPA